MKQLLGGGRLHTPASQRAEDVGMREVGMMYWVPG